MATTERGIKQKKTRPASNVVKLYEFHDYTLYWKGRAAPKRSGAKRPSPPRPKKWANIVLFLADTSRRKRSYHLAWNGERLNDSPETAALWDREPEIACQIEEELPRWNGKIIKGW